MSLKISINFIKYNSFLSFSVAQEFDNQLNLNSSEPIMFELNITPEAVKSVIDSIIEQSNSLDSNSKHSFEDLIALSLPKPNSDDDFQAFYF